MSFLLWNALQTSDTSHGESGKRTSIDRRPGETVLVFRADTPEFRRYFKVENVCDAIFFYKKPPARPVLMFVELKGKDVAHGAEQLRQTLLAVHAALKGALGTGAPFPGEMRAVIVSSGGAAPRELSLLREGFVRATGVALVVKTVKKGSCDLREILI